MSAIRAATPATELPTTAPKSKVYVITYAQNATPVNQPFLAALKTYCEHRKAALLVLPGRYKNPTSIWTQHNEHAEYWDPALEPFLFAGRCKLGHHLVVYGDISVQPTAVRPLTGFEVFTQDCSAIFGHCKVQLSTVATAKRQYPRILTTTGAVTQPNYTRSKAGKKAEAHHTYGATVVEEGLGCFHLRQITAEPSGAFIDLDKRYTSDGVGDAGRALALICGDIHVERSDASVIAATFEGPQSILGLLRPETVVYHDVLDFERRNHHSIHDFRQRYARVRGRMGDVVQDEVVDAIRFVDERTPPDAIGIVVQSNHDEAFDRWLDEAVIQRDPVNARLYHEMWAAKLSHYDSAGEWVSAFELAYRRWGQGRVRFLRRDEALRIADYECGFHGDKGLNGSRGTVETYARLGVRTVTAHSHSPAILDRATRVGVTGALDQGYNHTPSSWLQSHCAIYRNRQRTLIHVLGPLGWRGGT